MRCILHCDLNNFFASVEMLSRPELRNVPMAVSGDPNKRHGIILAKNERAKKFGIYTPETVYSALKKCPQLVLVKPHFEEYQKYSRLVNEIYQKYTDRVEKFGIDESFLDVTESTAIFGTPYEIAYKIKEEVKAKYGLTISVGVSFCKALAKLGSDLKKPDAITVLDEETYKEKIYHLPVEMLLFVGKNTHTKLNKMGIKTIGDLALSNKYRIVKNLGKIGELIYNYANGKDDEPVKFFYEKEDRKSISKGITFPEDLSDTLALEQELIKITSEISHELRTMNMRANVAQIILKDSNFVSINRQRKIEYTNSYDELVKHIIELFRENYVLGTKIRFVSVGASGLKNENADEQLDFFSIVEEKKEEKKVETTKKKKKKTAAEALDKLKSIYGDKIDYASAIKNNKN